MLWYATAHNIQKAPLPGCPARINITYHQRVLVYFVKKVSNFKEICIRVSPYSAWRYFVLPLGRMYGKDYLKAIMVRVCKCWDVAGNYLQERRNKNKVNKCAGMVRVQIIPWVS